MSDMHMFAFGSCDGSCTIVVSATFYLLPMLMFMMLSSILLVLLGQ